MPHALYSLAFLACPVGMGVMMWVMMRGDKQPMGSDANTAQAAKEAELRQLREEIAALRVGQERAGTSEPAR